MENDHRSVGNEAACISAGAGEMRGPVQILALETSCRDASAALLEADAVGVRIVREVAIGGSQRTAQILMPAVRSLMEASKWKPAEVQLVAIAVGPGSFTGLRIGVTMAKTFAYAVGAQVIGVHTLAVLTEQAGPACRPLWTVMDAQRQELFTARFDQAEATSDSVPLRVLSEKNWLGELSSGECVTGPALKMLFSRMPSNVHTVDSQDWQPRAGAVGIVGWREYCAGRRDDVWQLVPRYYRLSAAEEKEGSQGDMAARS